MLRGMNRRVPARIRPFSPEKRAFSLLLFSVVVILTLSQSSCSGVSSAALNANSGQFNASALTLDLGNVALGDNKTLAITLTNSTGSQLTVANVSVSGPGFSVNGISAGMNFSAGQTAVLSVTFTPASTGNVTGSITVTSNAQTSPITVALQGSGAPAGAHAATLYWDSSASSVNGYFVYRGTSSGGPYTAKLNSSPVTNTTYTDSSVQAGHSYYYVVTAVDADSTESAYSNEASATIPSP
jgi:hypothetical protein